MTVAYDGTDFRGFAANRGVATVSGTLADALETGPGPPGRAGLRRTHRCRGARLGSGDQLRRPGRRARRGRPGPGGDQAVRRTHRDPRGVGRRPGLPRPLLGGGRVVSLHGATTARCRIPSLAGSPGTSRRRSTWSACAWAVIRSSARTTSPRSVELRRCRPANRPPPWCAGWRRPLGRTGRRGPPLRDRGQRLLPPDGAQPGGNAGRPGPGPPQPGRGDRDAARRRPPRRRPGGPAPRPLPVGGPYPSGALRTCLALLAQTLRKRPGADGAGCRRRSLDRCTQMRSARREARCRGPQGGLPTEGPSRSGLPTEGPSSQTAAGCRTGRSLHLWVPEASSCTKRACPPT